MLRNVVITLILFVSAGCISIDDSIHWGVPKPHTGADKNGKVFVVQPIGASARPIYKRNGLSLMKNFAKAFSENGAEVVESKEHRTLKNDLAAASKAGCKYMLFMKIVRWEYGSSGWTGSGERNDIIMETMFFNVERNTVLARATLFVENGFMKSSLGGESSESSSKPVINRYVELLYKPEEKRFWEVKWD